VRDINFGSTVDKLNSKEGSMALLETLTFVLGIIYGYVSPGRENRGALIRKGLIIGIVLAIIFVALGLSVGGTVMALSGMFVFVEVVILTVLFIIGTWIGDWFEGRSKSRVAKASP
jgi:cation transport ATPase